MIRQILGATCTTYRLNNALLCSEIFLVVVTLNTIGEKNLILSTRSIRCLEKRCVTPQRDDDVFIVVKNIM